MCAAVKTQYSPTFACEPLDDGAPLTNNDLVYADARDVIFFDTPQHIRTWLSKGQAVVAGPPSN